MNKKLQEFLQSNLLDRYTIGDTSIEENKEIEYFIDNFEEAAIAYANSQNNLEILANFHSEQAPDILDNVVDKINNIKSNNNSDDIKVIQLTPTNSKTPWYYVAASVAAVLLSVASTALYFNNQALKFENQVVVDEIFDLRSDIEKTNAQLTELMLQFQKLNNPDAKKYVLTGNERAKDLKTVAYINPVERTSMLDIISLPTLPEDQCYQIWGELQDRMVSLGIIDPRDAKLKPLPYLDQLTALTISVEPKGGNLSTSREREVAEIILNQ